MQNCLSVRLLSRNRNEQEATECKLRLMSRTMNRALEAQEEVGPAARPALGKVQGLLSRD